MSGPMPLGDLHGYQAEIIDELAHIIGSRGKGTHKSRLADWRREKRGSRSKRQSSTCSRRTAAANTYCGSRKRTSCANRRSRAPPSLEQLWQRLDGTQDRSLMGREPDPTPSADDVPTTVVATIPR